MQQAMLTGADGLLTIIVLGSAAELFLILFILAVGAGWVEDK